MLKYCLDRYKTQDMCDKAVDTCLPALKFAPDWFVTDVFSNDNIDLDNIDSDTATFFNGGVGFVTMDLNNNINLDDGNFDEDDPTNIVLVGRIAARRNIACRKMDTFGYPH